MRCAIRNTSSPGRIKAAAICGILVTFVSSAIAQLREQERTLNLQGLQPVFAHASGKRLVLGVTTNHVSVLLTLVKPTGTPLKERDLSDREQNVQILFGKDVLGFAEVSLNS